MFSDEPSHNPSHTTPTTDNYLARRWPLTFLHAAESWTRMLTLPLCTHFFQLSRGLRARLSYATYKATHNLAHATLRDLEEQAEKQHAVVHASAGKPSSNYYNNPATQGNSAMTSTAPVRSVQKRGSMPPPPVSASAGKSLYSSILAPPPAKRARTIHNPQDPPIVAPPKPQTSTPARKSGKQARSNPSTSGKHKSTRKDDKGKGKDLDKRSTGHRLTPRSSFESVNDDVDMKAAATLTSLLLSRPALSASSPRSSMSAGSDAGSLHSYSQYAQSSTRTTTGGLQGQSFAAPYARSSTPPPLSKRTQSLSQASDVRFHSHSRSVPNAKVTPKTQSQPIISANSRAYAHSNSPRNPPTDSEAADLMLFLATSPSPARPTTTKDRDAKDAAAFRSLSGNPALQGRVLFSGPASASGSGDGQAYPHAHQSRGKPLQRDGSGFSSTLSIATDASGETVYAPGSTHQRPLSGPISVAPSSSAGLSTKHASFPTGPSQQSSLNVPQMPTVTPPTPTDQVPQNAQLPIAQPNSPSRPASRESARAAMSGTSSSQTMTQSSTRLSPHPVSAASSFSSSSSSTPATQYPGSAAPSSASIPTAPPTPSSHVPFNLHDFLNVSPSPAAATTSKTGNSNSLRADVGRRLFEEHHGAIGHNHGHGQGGSGAGLGAGIDLVNT